MQSYRHGVSRTPCAGMQRSSSAYEMFLALADSPIQLTCSHSTRCLEGFEPLASQAMPCLA